jgi:hypothetical protein
MTKPIPPLPPDAAEALAKGHLLEAVKRLRAATPMGLAEAKNVLEWHLRHRAQSMAGAAAKASPRPAGLSPVPKHHAGGHAPRVHVPGRPGLSPGEVPKTSGGGFGVVVLLAIAAGIVYYFLR